MKFVIKRIDGVFVAKPGSRSSYTNKLQNARIYNSQDEAQRDLCVENERIVPLESFFG